DSVGVERGRAPRGPRPVPGGTRLDRLPRGTCRLHSARRNAGGHTRTRRSCPLVRARSLRPTPTVANPRSARGAVARIDQVVDDLHRHLPGGTAVLWTWPVERRPNRLTLSPATPGDGGTTRSRPRSLGYRAVTRTDRDRAHHCRRHECSSVSARC